MRSTLRRARLAVTLVALAGWLLTAPACRDEPPAPEGDSGTPSALKLTLPPGWAAESTSEQTLRAGPPGKPVLEIRLVKGGGDTLPDPELLERSFAEALGGAQLRVLRREQSDTLSLIGLEVRRPDGKRTALAFLGAKRVADDLYLCRSLPGATEVELEGAVAACKGISRTAP